MTDVRIALDKLAADVAAALPPLDPDQRRVGLAVYRLMAAGTPATPAAIARATGLSAARAAEVVRGLPTATAVDGEVTAFLGLQLAPGRHALRVGAQSLATWCAWDTLFLPALLGRPARVSSACPVTKEAVTVEVDPGGGVTNVSPQGTLLSFLAEPTPFAGELVAGFCRWIHFLADASAAEAWLAGSGTGSDRPPMIVLPLEDGVELGRRTNHAVFGVPG